MLMLRRLHRETRERKVFGVIKDAGVHQHQASLPI